MAREEQDAAFGKQEEALKRYIDDNLRRYEERHHAAQRENTERFAHIQDAQRENNERFAQIQDDQRENNERSIRLEELLLERRHRHSSRSSSWSSHRSDARSKVPSEVGQGQRHAFLTFQTPIIILFVMTSRYQNQVSHALVE